MKNKILIVILILLSIVLFYQLKGPHRLLGWYLSPSDKLTQADAIVVVSGDNDRTKHAIELYKQGYAPKIIFSGAASDGQTSNAFAMALEASHAGILKGAMILEEKATNTYENAHYSKEIIQTQGMNNIILVTSPYHQRRVYETFKSLVRDSNIKLQNSPTPYCKWKGDSWWNTNQERYLTHSEIGKILWANITGNYK